MSGLPGYDGVPDPTGPLVIMVGPPGAGKSTWAAARFPEDQLFSLDMFRRMLTGDVLDQEATPKAVVILYSVIGARLDRCLTTVVDATNVRWDRRESMRSYALARHRPVIAVMMHTPLAVCLTRNRDRTSAPWAGANDKPVPDDVVERMHAAVAVDWPRPADFDMVVHVHPADTGVAYAYPGEGRSAAWCEELISVGGQWRGVGPWRGLTLMTSQQAPLPWPTPVNGRG